MSLFHAIFDKIPQALFVLNSKHDIIYHNHSALEQFKGQLPAIGAQHLAQDIQHDIIHDYTDTHYDASFIPIQHQDAHYIAIMFAAKNNSALSNEQQQELQIIMQGFAHEMKNPLFAIRGAAQLLQQQLAQNPLCDVIIQEIDRLDTLINKMSILQYADSVAALTPCNIHEILTPLIDAAQVSYGLDKKFIQQYDPSLPLVLAHPDSLSQALSNIIKNACEASKNSITIRTAYIMNPILIAYDAHEKKYPLALRLSIEDDGHGFSEDDLRMADTVFYSTKAGGQGLGLALAKKILHSHKGRLVISNTKEQHALVTCDLLVSM